MHQWQTFSPAAGLWMVCSLSICALNKIETNVHVNMTKPMCLTLSKSKLSVRGSGGPANCCSSDETGIGACFCLCWPFFSSSIIFLGFLAIIVLNTFPCKCLHGPIHIGASAPHMHQWQTFGPAAGLWIVCSLSICALNKIVMHVSVNTSN